MSTQRDELARAIHSTEQLGCGCCTDYNYTREQDQHADKLDVNTRAVAIGDTLLAAGWTKPRIITGPEDLRGLGCGSVVHCTGDLTGEGDGDQTLICDIAPNRVSHLIWRNHWMRITTPALFQSYETITVLFEPTA